MFCSSEQANLEELDSFQSLQEILLKIKERALSAVTASFIEAKTTDFTLEPTPGCVSLYHVQYRHSE